MLLALGLQSLRKGIQIRKKENAMRALSLEKKKFEQNGAQEIANSKITKTDSVNTTEPNDGLEVVKFTGPKELKEITLTE